eukprot:5005692-Pleurochrysis_carterae.AAC.1
MSSPLGMNLSANIIKIVFWSNLGSRDMATRRSRVSAGSGRPVSGTWHRRTCHPSSDVNSVTGVIGRIWKASAP